MSTFYIVPESKTSIRILDPGCGLGILSCALCEHIIKSGQIREIYLDVFETDLQLIDLANKVLDYLQRWLLSKGVQFNYHLCVNDFVLHNSSVLLGQLPAETYDVAISNPPYFKISKDNPLRKVTKSILHGQQNIYSIFIFLMVKLLVDQGRIIFISPRSFTSGGYFRTFRNFIFNELTIECLHLFHSRKNVFKRDRVLQENVIVSARRRSFLFREQGDLFGSMDYINIYQSSGIDDMQSRVARSYHISDLVNLLSDQKIFHIPMSDEDENAISIFKKWTNSFSKSGIKISTGPVVSFRASEYLVKNETKNVAPLIWLNNVDKMSLNWPLLNITNERPQYISYVNGSLSMLIENRNIVIIRRFSSKDDKRKLIAAPLFKDDFKCEMIGLENHVNYLYSVGYELSDDYVYGISTLLNSTLFDIYFRTFNGNINVSATELREIPLPDDNIILNLGKAIKKKKKINQEVIDYIVEKKFELKHHKN